MKLAIMQPYFLPYLGYWQLMNYVDKYVLYDNIEYTKKGWINRNRYLNNGEASYFTIPLKKDSDYLDIVDRQIADSFQKEKIWNQLCAAYKKAPYWKNVQQILDEIFSCDDKNLFNFIFSSILVIRKWLDIKSELIISSQLPIDHSLRGAEKVKSICKILDVQTYINPIGGISLYNSENFQESGIELQFIRMKEGLKYSQYGTDYIQALSIIDVFAFNSVDEIKELLNEFEILNGGEIK